MTPRHLIVGTLAMAVLGASLGTVATTADAAPKPKAYKNCKALNKDYPHGVARKGGKDHVSGSSKPVTNFTVNTKVYQMNDGRVKEKGQYDLDRDNDGVACEKR